LVGKINHTYYEKEGIMSEPSKTPIIITWESQQESAERIIDNLCADASITLTPDARSKAIEAFISDVMETIDSMLNNFDEYFDFDEQMAVAICDTTGVDYIEQLADKEDN
jgi:vacuolar-type H+-ATPase subunit E/Vma4